MEHCGRRNRKPVRARGPGFLQQESLLCEIRNCTHVPSTMWLSKPNLKNDTSWCANMDEEISQDPIPQWRATSNQCVPKRKNQSSPGTSPEKFIESQARLNRPNLLFVSMCGWVGVCVIKSRSLIWEWVEDKAGVGEEKGAQMIVLKYLLWTLKNKRINTHGEFWYKIDIGNISGRYVKWHF